MAKKIIIISSVIIFAIIIGGAVSAATIDSNSSNTSITKVPTNSKSKSISTPFPYGASVSVTNVDFPSEITVDKEFPITTDFNNPSKMISETYFYYYVSTDKILDANDEYYGNPRFGYGNIGQAVCYPIYPHSSQTIHSKGLISSDRCDKGPGNYYILTYGVSFEKEGYECAIYTYMLNEEYVIPIKINFPPPISSISYVPSNPYVGDNVNFASVSIAPYGYIKSYLWNFGDGTTSTDQQLSHIFKTSGQKTVTLTVTDSYGVKNTATKIINVKTNTPILNVFSARMVSPNYLGIGIKANQPWADSNVVKYLVISGVINGKNIKITRDITQYFNGDNVSVGLGSLNTVLTNTLLNFNLKALGVPNFNKNTAFNLSAKIIVDNIPSNSKTAIVKVYLPVVLVHGFNSSYKCWTEMGYKLSKEGMFYFPFNYAPGLQDPYKVSDTFGTWMKNNLLSKYMYSKYNIVCHSMGALVTRFWLQKSLTRSYYVNKWIGLAPVNSGAAVTDVWYHPLNPRHIWITKNTAYLALLSGINFIAPMSSAAAKNMQTSNPEIIALNKKTLPQNVRFYTIIGVDGHEVKLVDTVEKPPNNGYFYRFTKAGDGVVANTQSKLPGAANIPLTGVKHTAMPSNTKAIYYTIYILKAN